MACQISGRLRPRFLVRDRSVLTGLRQRIPQRFGLPVNDPISDEPFEMTVFRYPGAPGAPQLLAVHGFRGDHHGLELIVDGLTDFDVWVPDLPGFGASPAMPAADHTAANYAHVMNQVAAQLDCPVLLGHSFGSVIASYAATSPRADYSHLVVLNPITKPALAASWGINRAATAVTDAFYQLCARLPARSGRWLLSSPVVVWATGAFMTKTDDPRVLAYTHDQHQAYFSGFESATTLLQAYRSSVTDTVTAIAPDLQLPVTIVAGAQDEMSSPEEVAALSDMLSSNGSDVEAYVLDRTGHLLHYERAATTAAMIQFRLRD